MKSLLRSPPSTGAGGHGRVLFALMQCVPFLIALAVLVIELTPAHFIYTGPFLTAVPALAAVTMGPRGTAAAALLALAISVTTATYNQAWGTLQVYTNFLALALVTAAGLVTSRAVQARRQRELDQVRRIAVAAQDVVLRPVPPRLGPLLAGSLSLAAGTGAQVGGDLYEAVQTRYGVRMIVGDVRGKGLSAVRAVAVAVGAFREAVHYENDLVEVMNHCSAALRRAVAASAAHDSDILLEGFTTALIAQVPDESVVQLVNRGHPPPLLLHRGRATALMPSTPSPPLGLEDLGPPAEPETYPFLPGDRLLLYTDGVIEARNRGNEFFALPETMEGIHDSTTPPEFLEQLHLRLTRHTGGDLTDDVAMILVDRLDGTAPEPPAGHAR
ncbi:serine/threonine-protein phosphatase [Streptomyces pluripotens]|uniref:Serine/threonine-protein phosphatase n=1 Tax=Streptomyces pluripotens TaxID=1355015 RepID=A0A221P1V1_9ACTN|nr:MULTISPECIES: PP2C family protein-serine/threonine phosphatase [Streptomyces]ARP71786.1 serine/threonine protein phosphatase [Streptomyces pluripotens]ASN26038.1 serine/threonine-protein phosphatase [Streptomyces pluripotens]KIE26203.1 serine/threonine protein phosphatase [Streptomyces sp. MUSC 125]MCH0556262.1 serine/threonine-protein phosphatase [Streptomyces sp. MUM 16J]